MEGLQGEIILWNSQPFVTSVSDERFATSNSFDHKAALLVYAQVPRWREVEIPADVKDSADLEEFTGKTSRLYDNPVTMPLPFLLKGQVRDLQWHVIDWAPGDTVHTHQKHTTSVLHGQLEDQAIEIVGFNSNQHHGVITHHSSNMHLHVKPVASNMAAHVDGLELDGRARLYVPEY